jgi:general secretion pathway protein D
MNAKQQTGRNRWQAWASRIALAGAVSLSAGGPLHSVLSPARCAAQGPALAPARAATPQPAVPAGTIEGHLVPAGDLSAMLATLERHYQGRGDVRLAVEPRTRKIVAVAPPEVQREIAQWIAAQAAAPNANAPPAGVQPAAAEVPAEEAATRSTDRVALAESTWGEFEQRLFRIWGNRLTAATNAAEDMAMFRIRTSKGETTLEVDRRNAQVTITAPGNSAASWRKVVETIDRAPPAGRDARIVPLDNADPSAVLRAISLIRAATGENLLASRRKQHIGQFVGMVFQQEGAGAAAGQPAPPPAVPAGEPGGEAPGPGAEGGDEGEPGADISGVTIDIIDGQAIIRGRKEDVDRVLAIIDEIERQSIETRPEIELVPLKFVDATALNEVLTTIAPTAFAYQGTVTITALRRPNALLLVGRKENIPAVIELIQKLDRPTPAGAQIKVFRLKNMSSIDAERFVRNFFVEDPGRTQTPRTNLGTRVLTIADFRSNILIVQGSPRDLEEVSQLLEQLDTGESEVKNEVKVFKLQNSIAEELAPALQEAIIGTGQAQQGQQGQQQGAGGQGGPTPAIATRRATMLQLRRIDRNGQEILQSGILADMRITADPRSNSLVVVGPEDAMDLIAELIRQLDELPGAEAQIKVFTMTNGDATTLADVLNSLFGQPTGGGGANQPNLQTATGAEGSTLVPLRFSVDQRTNSIIATGNPGDLDVVRNILVRLDLPDLTQRLTTVYRLHNAPAADVALAINNLLTRVRQLNQAAPELVTPYQLVASEVLVEAETVTNSLIVSATPTYFEKIKQIVTELDRRPPMVAIQVLIAEVTLNDDEQFGIEWGLQDSLMFDRSIATNRYSFNNNTLPNDNTAASLATRENVAGQALSNLAVGRIDPTLGFGGLVLTASNESVSVLLRALQASSRAQVIARPQVQTLDNQPAYVNVGARVPRIIGATTTNFGVQPTVTDVPVGIILEVTPRTSPDGTIVMQIYAEKSSVGPDATGIPVFTDVNGNVIRSPQIPITTAQTTVSARSGQTVILGGLITKDQTEATRRIPYVSDIPMLGRLFRFDSYRNQRTELLIIMTPFIMQTEEQNEWLNARESERMSWCIADVVNIHGPIGSMSGNPAYNSEPTDVIFPDVDPAAPTPANPNAPPPGLPMSPPTGVPMPPAPGLPLDPLLPPGGGYGFVPTAPVQTGPVQTGLGTEPVGTGPIGPGASPAGLAPLDGRLQPQPIQPVVPPPGTQAGLVPPPGAQAGLVPASATQARFAAPGGFQFQESAAPPQVAPAYYIPPQPGMSPAAAQPQAQPGFTAPTGSVAPGAPAYAPPQLPPLGPVTQVSYQR